MEASDYKIKLNKSAKIALIFGLSPFVLMFMYFWTIDFINWKFGNRDCLYKEIYEKLHFKGLIIEKDFDRKSHMQPYIVILDTINNSIETRFYKDEKTDELFEILKVNDYIIKDIGNSVFKVKRDSNSFDIIIELNCDEDDFYIEP